MNQSLPTRAFREHTDLDQLKRQAKELLEAVRGGDAAAIKEVNAGGSPMSSHIARKIVQSFQQSAPASKEMETLSQREAEVLDLLAKGFLYKEIAEKMGVTYATVHTHIRHIYEKLHVRSRTEAVAKHLNQPRATREAAEASRAAGAARRA